MGKPIASPCGVLLAIHANSEIMEERNLSEKESLEVITSMIARTRRRYIGDGSIMLMWGYLVTVVAILVWIMLAVTGQQIWNILWFAIPLIGGIATPVMARKQRDRQGVKTYSDDVTSRLWTIAGISEGVMILICLALELFAGADCWRAMLAYSLTAVPLAEIAQGLFIKERSLTAGGIVGLTVGIITTCCLAGDIPLYVNWFMPLFILGFVAMMIVPGHVLNHKARQER